MAIITVIATAVIQRCAPRLPGTTKLRLNPLQVIGLDLMPDRQHFLAREVLGWFTPVVRKSRRRTLPVQSVRPPNREQLRVRVLEPVPYALLWDCVIRFNAHGPESLINNPSPGVPPKLEAEHRSFLSRVVEDGPIRAVHGVVRWRACDLIALLQEGVGLSALIRRDLCRLGL